MNVHVRVLVAIQRTADQAQARREVDRRGRITAAVAATGDRKIVAILRVTDTIGALGVGRRSAKVAMFACRAAVLVAHAAASADAYDETEHQASHDDRDGVRHAENDLWGFRCYNKC